ncbi:MAG TPA: BlaI/MecI/CopY family transcriptional regulator [Steroidobacteraceae bacterium]|jgi:predicted transcriptional regulator|nr:BlaI/MecI/CopY family transcriptional regulator [Steroidobacteraceae bacterium]
MSVPESISEAESAVLAVLWEKGAVAAEEVVAALAGPRDWQESTVKTLLGRLLKKGAVQARKDGRRFIYSPALAREEWLARESESLLNRLFGGRVAPLVAHFSRHRKLSKRDIRELKRLVEELEGE